MEDANTQSLIPAMFVHPFLDRSIRDDPRFLLMYFVRVQPCIFVRACRGNTKLISEGNAMQTERGFVGRVDTSARLWPSVTSPAPCPGFESSCCWGEGYNSVWYDTVVV